MPLHELNAVGREVTDVCHNSPSSFSVSKHLIV
jgi:hypothetical protein